MIIPKLNEKDLPDIPAEVKKKITFRPVETVDEVLEVALSSVPKNGAVKKRMNAGAGSNGKKAKGSKRVVSRAD